MLAQMFKRDPMDLRGPEVQKAPEKSFSLSQSRLSFRCPPQSAMIPGYTNGDTFDFERDTDEEIGDPHNRFQIIFDTGWDFEDAWWKPMSYGSVCMGVFISHNNQYKTPEESLFEENNLINHSLRRVRNSFIRMSAGTAQIKDDEVTEFDIKNKTHCRLEYPENKKGINVVRLGKTRWVQYETYFPNQAPKICFQTAAGHNHMVRFLFSQSAHGGIDFFSPKHNLKEACRVLINDIMSTVTVELSPEAQKQKDAVIELYGPDQVV